MAKPVVTFDALLGDDDFDKAIMAQAKLEAGDKDWKDTELDRLQKELNKKLEIIDNACKKMKEGKTDALVLESINLQFKLKKNTIKAEYAKLMEPSKVSTDVINIVAEEVPYQKTKQVFSKVAAPVRVVKGVFNGVVDGLGLRGFTKH